MHPMHPRTLLPLLLVLACGDDTKTSATADTTSSTGDTSSSTGDTSDTSTSTTAPTTDGSAEASNTDTGVDTSTGAPLTTSTTSTTDLTTTGETGDTTTGGLPDGCHDDSECDPDAAEFCFAPDENNCGACQVPDAPCLDQSECDIGLLCVPFDAPCACEPGAMQCVPILPCMNDQQCADDQFCDQNACAPATCDGQMFDCPPLFDCVPNSAPKDHCVRRACEADEDCDGAFCVENRCFETLGACMPPAP